MPTASGSIAFLGAARFQGYWNAATNEATGSGLDGAAPYHPDVGGASPGDGYTTLLIDGGYHATTNLTASGGDYWQVTGSGTTAINGYSNWALNDWVIYSASAGDTGIWKRLSFQDTIASVIMGRLDSSVFHMGTDNDKHVIFASGSAHSGSSTFIYDYTNERLVLGATSGADYSNLNVVDQGGSCLVAIDSHTNGSGATKLNLRRARGTTKASPSIVQDGDSLGELTFYGYNDEGTGFDAAAMIEAFVDGTPGDDSSDMPGRLAFLTTADGSGTPTERMTIKADGNVGIGEANPSDRLVVTGSVGVAGIVRANLFANPSTIPADTEVPPNHNAILYGPITVENGETLTVGAGATLKITDA